VALVGVDDTARTQVNSYQWALTMMKKLAQHGRTDALIHVTHLCAEMLIEALAREPHARLGAMVLLRYLLVGYPTDKGFLLTITHTPRVVRALSSDPSPISHAVLMMFADTMYLMLHLHPHCDSKERSPFGVAGRVAQILATVKVDYPPATRCPNLIHISA
jgi:hypothetical protein